MCTEVEHAFWDRANSIQNKVNGIRDCLSIIEGNLMDFADKVYDGEYAGAINNKGCIE